MSDAQQVPSDKKNKLLNVADKNLTRAQKLIDAGNKLADKGEKYLVKLKALNKLVTVVMAIALTIFLIVASVCSLSIYHTYQSASENTQSVEK